MASLETVNLPGALNGEMAGRVLRSHSAKAVLPNVKLLDSKITFKVTKKEAVVKGKPRGKREAGALAATESALEESRVLKAEQEKRPRKSRKKSIVVSETSTVSLATPELATEDAKTLGLESSPVAKVAVASAKRETWSISLSTAEAIAIATKHLVAADAKLGDIIGAQGLCPVLEHKGSSFSALVRSIVYQQLAGKAADTIYARLNALCGGADSVTPAVIAALTAEELRAVGISGRKAIYLHDLAEKFTSGFLTDEKLATLNEDDLVTALTAVKGIGVWSAHMFMMFYLHKPDVLPVGDLGIRKGFMKLYELKQQPSPGEMQELALSWRPYRTLASWYLWRMNDIKVPAS